jgi:L-threonylcarbamoyladenylate synthase
MRVTSSIKDCIEALKSGQFVGMPTETVYGLACDATNPRAVAGVYEAKGRPQFNPLISHVASLEAAQMEGVFSPTAMSLAQAFWPGPLTLVLPRRREGRVCDLACAGLETLALRVPAHRVTQALLEAFGRPIAAPSANRSGRPSPTTSQHVRDEFSHIDSLVLEGGACQVGLESSVVAVDGEHVTLLRSGGVSRADLEALVGPLMQPKHEDNAAPASPGMLLRHYAPRAPLIINATTCPPDGIFIGFGPDTLDARFNLSPSGDVVEAASNLFAMLRSADALSPEVIAVARVPMLGIGEAINDRLVRAAAR